MMSAMALPSTWTRVILGFLLVMLWAFSVEGGSEMATTELHKTLIRRWIDEVWNQGDMAVADEIFEQLPENLSRKGFVPIRG
jgi:hypothetical protein